MILPDKLGPLFWHLHGWFEKKEEARKIPALQSNTEDQLNARSKLQPHRPFLVREPRWSGDRWISDGRGLWEDDGIRNGPVFVGQGDEFAAEARGLPTHPAPQLQSVDTVASAFNMIDKESATGILLAHLARDFLADCLCPFGRPFGEEGDQNRPLAPSVGIAPPPRRGAGTIAHLMPTALALWGDSKTAAREIEAIGLRIGPHGRKKTGSDEDRQICRAIATETVRASITALRKLETTRKTLAQRLPSAIRRVG
jgi:hypothetical protein